MQQRLRPILWLLALGALAGCVAPLENSPVENRIADVSAFFWNRSSLASGIRYTIQGDTAEEHLLTSSDGEHIDDISGSSAGALVIRSNRDSIIVDSISTHTIFLLPPGFAFSPQPTPLAVKAILEFPTRRLLAATSSGVYYSDDRLHWNRAASFDHPVAVLSYDSIQHLAYASAADSVYSSAEGSLWTPAGRPRAGKIITAMAIAAKGKIYIGYDDSTGVDHGDFGYGFSSFAGTGRGVRSIAVADSANRHRVGVATDESIIIYDDTAHETMSSYLYNTMSVTTISVSAMLGVQGAGLTNFNLASLQPIPLNQSASEQLTVALQYKGLYYAGGIGGRLFRGVASLSEVANLSSQINAMIVSGSGDVLIATDTGLWSFDGTTALKLNGPYADQPKSGAPALLLLDRENGALAVGSSWQAGNLYVSAVRTSVPITAHVIDHVDTLVTPLGGRFGESYVVRYAFESGGKIDPSIPVYWLVYYSRGSGPTIIEEYTGTYGTYTVKSRASMIQ